MFCTNGEMTTSKKTRRMDQPFDPSGNSRRGRRDGRLLASRTIEGGGDARVIAPSQALQPIGRLFFALPHFPIDTEGALDCSLVDVVLLRQVAEAGDAVAGVVSRGTRAIGQLMAYSAPDVEDGTVDSDAVEALGWLLSMLGELGALCGVLALNCMRAAQAVEPPSSSSPVAPPVPPASPLERPRARY
jgi:hypothetical protein